MISAILSARGLEEMVNEIIFPTFTWGLAGGKGEEKREGKKRTHGREGLIGDG